MKARIIDQQVKVYSSMDENSVSIATLPEGSEIEFGGSKRKAGKVWVPITLSTGQQAFIPGESRIFIIREGAVLQNGVKLQAEPSVESTVKQEYAKNTHLYILQVVKGDGGDTWVRARDMSGNEGYISGDTRIRVIQQKTKALGRKNMVSGAMWLVAGGVILFSNGSQGLTSSFSLLGYGALLYGVVMLAMGVYQLVTSPA